MSRFVDRHTNRRYIRRGKFEPLLSSSGDSGFVVYVIKKVGTPDAYMFEDLLAAEDAWWKLKKRLETGKALGIGLDRITDSGALRPIQCVSNNLRYESNLFVKRALQFERHWYRRAR